MPLHVEILYNEYQFAAAFAVASLLALLALVTLVLKYCGRAARQSQKRSTATARNRSIGMSIEVRNLNKRFGATVVCDNLNLDIPAGELVALLGPSGSGKTTLLRIIAGLEVPDTGSVLFHGEDATGTDVRERNVGFVFQHYALFRHMTHLRERGLRPARAAEGDAARAKREIRDKVHASC